MERQILVGREEIAEYVKRSWRTIKRWIDTEGFPAKKMGRRWESDAGLIQEWRRKQISK